MRKVNNSKIQKFTDLITWQEAHKLTLIIYEVTNTFPSSEKFNLTSQMRRAAVSDESCIAEGFCRFHYKERLQFYYDARGSLGELTSQTITAKDLKFMTPTNYQSIMAQIEKTGVVLGGLIRETFKRSASR